MQSLEADLADARDLDVDALADAVEAIGFECTRCGACCKAEAEDPHTATVFPDEVRDLQDATDRDWRDLARPMPYGLDAEADAGGTGETFEWALQTDACGDCVFYDEDRDGDGTGGETAAGPGRCTVHDDRPLVCETYPFSVAIGGTTQPMGGVVEREGPIRAHECEGLGRDIEREDAVAMAETLKERAVRELEEAIAVRDGYEPVASGDRDVVVFDGEGAKGVDGLPLDGDAGDEG
ncbi:MAG: YkgJ family cysteine cluster protein [Halobacteriaceae archaeon]